MLRKYFFSEHFQFCWPCYIHERSLKEYKEYNADNKNERNNDNALNKNIPQIIVRKNIFCEVLSNKKSYGIMHEINRITHSSDDCDPFVCKKFV